MKKYYIAYGSNLNKEQMKLRCPDAKVMGTANMEDYELLFKGSKTGAYLTIEKKKGSHVPVAVWEVSKADEKRLDAYEGYPAFYYKKQVKIQNPDGKPITAFVYIMHEDRKIGVPSKFYIDTCLEGYHDFGFDEKLIFEAIERSIGIRHAK